MGMTAGVYQITPSAYAALERTDVEVFSAGFSEERLDLDKTWHAISYLVTGAAELGFLQGGVELPEVSEPVMGYSPSVVRELNERLTGTSTEALLSRYDAADFNSRDIYPGGWDESGIEYIGPYLHEFAILVRSAAKVGNGLAVIIA
jgi:hypothetical protein